MGKRDYPPDGNVSTRARETASERMAVALGYVQERERSLLARIGEAVSSDEARSAARHIRAKDIPGFKVMSKEEKPEIGSTVDAANAIIDETLENKLKELSESATVESAPDFVKTPDVRKESGESDRMKALADLLNRSGFMEAIGLNGEVGDDHGEIVAALREQYIDWLKQEDGSESWTPEQVFDFLSVEEEKNPSQITLESEHTAPEDEQLPEKHATQAGETPEEVAPTPDTPEKAPEAVADDQKGIASAFLEADASAGSVVDIEPSAQPTEDASRPDSSKPISESEDASIADEIRKGIAKVRKTIAVMERNEKLPSETIATLRRSLSEKERRVEVLLKGEPEESGVSQELADILSDIPDVSAEMPVKHSPYETVDVPDASVGSDAELRAKKELEALAGERRDALVAGANALVDRILALVGAQLGENEGVSDDEVTAIEEQVLLPSLKVYLGEVGVATSKSARSRETVKRKMLEYFRSRVEGLRMAPKSTGNAA